MPMNTSARELYCFLTACSGNWRNTIYISQTGGGNEFLMAADRDGKPVVMTIARLRQLVGEQIDPDECRGHLTWSAFQDIYAQYLLWQCPKAGTDIPTMLCPSIQ